MIVVGDDVRGHTCVHCGKATGLRAAKYGVGPLEIWLCSQPCLEAFAWRLQEQEWRGHQ